MLGRVKVLSEIILGRVGLRRDFVGYEVLLKYIKERQLLSLEGDLLEIGAFLGGGTVKLANAAERHGKRVVVIDIFDPAYDSTANSRGETMKWIYQAILGRRDLRGSFLATAGRKGNVSVLQRDSRTVAFPAEQKFVFSFIDGGHASEVTSSDARLAWLHTVGGGVVAFHDYGGDLPCVTDAIDEFVKRKRTEVAEVQVVRRKRVIFVMKRNS